jgi:hypothetical protein
MRTAQNIKLKWGDKLVVLIRERNSEIFKINVSICPIMYIM